MPIDPNELRSRAERLRKKAADLTEIGKTVRDGGIRDAYQLLVTEYDMMADQLERLAKEA
jgi:hypothetical protein